MTYLLILLLLFISDFQKDQFVALREKMVKEQIEGRGIKHVKVLEAMRQVPRHLFVGKEYLSQAYEDSALPISHNQTISQPYIVGFMTAAIDPQQGDRVLEIGTGSGYQAAVLAEIVKEIYTVEIIPGLGSEAKRTLEKLKYENVKVKIADGFHGWQEYAPYDAIIVTAAAEDIPPALVDQLKTGGKMIIPIGPHFSVQNLVLITKQKNTLLKEKLLPVRFVPFTREKE